MIDPASMNDPVNAKEISVTPEEIAELATRAREQVKDVRMMALLAATPAREARFNDLADLVERQAQVIAELDTLLDSAQS